MISDVKQTDLMDLMRRMLAESPMRVRDVLVWWRVAYEVELVGKKVSFKVIDFPKTMDWMWNEININSVMDMGVFTFDESVTIPASSGWRQWPCCTFELVSICSQLGVKLVEELLKEANESRHFIFNEKFQFLGGV